MSTTSKAIAHRRGIQALATLRSTTRALAPIVRRALAKHGRAGQKVFLRPPGAKKAVWVAVTRTGELKAGYRVDGRVTASAKLNGSRTRAG